VRDGRFIVEGQETALPADGVRDGAAILCVRPHDFALASSGEGFAARVTAVQRRADRITVEAQLPQQPRALEIDSLAAPGAGMAATGTDVVCKPLRYRVFPV
jgi:ABC-type sulfate/molybdate transport systems ATPase subunit